MAIIVTILKAVLGVAFDQALNLAITLGIPWLVEWIYKHPKTPTFVKWLMDKVNITALLVGLVEELKKIQVSNVPVDEKTQAARAVKREVREKAKVRAGKPGYGSDTVGLG